MAKKNYYKILGVSRTASPEEISAAKNRLAKKYHPDANMKDGIDTTKKMQHNNIEETDPVIGTPFVNYWRAADSLYDITLESEQLFKDKNKENTRSARLSDLAAQALSYAVILREAEIPEKYWLPAIMDWLLFTWYKNRNLPVSYLLKLYDEYSKKELNGFKRVKIQKEQLHFQHSLKRLVNYG